MAEIYNLGAGLTMYNVSYGVGEGMPNKPDDVMLVQWLLKHHFGRPDKKAKLGNVWFIDIVTGFPGPMLYDIIKIYQYDACLSIKNADIAMNGKIYPIQACGGLNKSAVALLNLSVSGHYKHFYEAPKTDPCLYSEAKETLGRLAA